MSSLRSVIWLVVLGAAALLGLRLLFGAMGVVLALVVWALPLLLVGGLVWWLWGKVVPTTRGRVADEIGVSASSSLGH